jgi:hypothetical protein
MARYDIADKPCNEVATYYGMSDLGPHSRFHERTGRIGAEGVIRHSLAIKKVGYAFWPTHP